MSATVVCHRAHRQSSFWHPSFQLAGERILLVRKDRDYKRQQGDMYCPPSLLLLDLTHPLAFHHQAPFAASQMPSNNPSAIATSVGPPDEGFQKFFKHRNPEGAQRLSEIKSDDPRLVRAGPPMSGGWPSEVTEALRAYSDSRANTRSREKYAAEKGLARGATPVPRSSKDRWDDDDEMRHLAWLWGNEWAGVRKRTKHFSSSEPFLLDPSDIHSMAASMTVTDDNAPDYSFDALLSLGAINWKQRVTSPMQTTLIDLVQDCPILFQSHCSRDHWRT